MMNMTKFVYRVVLANSKRETGTFIAEISADLDETARRRIIAVELKAGGNVRSITTSADRGRKPGDWPRRTYKD